MTGTVHNPIPAAPPNDHPYYRLGLVGRAMAELNRVTSVGFSATVEVEGELEASRLKRAWDSVRQQHPILRCRLEKGRWRYDPSSTGPATLTVERIAGGHRLTLDCDHVAFDGLGSVILIRDLRKAYARDADPLGVDLSTRDFDSVQAVRTIGKDLATALRAASRWRSSPPSTHRDPSLAVPASPSTSHHVMDMGPVLHRFSQRRRAARWSTDAVLVGVLERAWTDVFGASGATSMWLVAQDMRPSLEMSRGLGNLSVIDAVAAGDTVATTARSVTTELESHRHDLLEGVTMASRYPGLASSLIGAGFSRGRRLRYHRSLSNVGQLGESLDDWVTARATRIYFVGPMAHPPYTSFIAAGHGHSTWVTVRTSPDWLTNSKAKELESAALAIQG